MKARAIKKRLMRGRVNCFWGRRAYLSVRLPSSAIGPILFCPTPDDDPDASGAAWSGVGWETWIRETAEPDGTLREYWSLSELSTGRTRAELLAAEPSIAPQHAFEDDHGWARYYEGVHGTQLVPHGAELDPGQWRRRTIAPEIIDRYIAWKAWHGALHDPSLAPTELLRAFAWVEAKSTYVDVTAETFTYTYGVKWFYPRRKLRFASDLARALRMARRLGVDARVMRAR